MLVGKKALVGFLGIGVAVSALGWMFLPKNSKIKKAIAGKASELGSILKNHIDEVISITSDRKKSQSAAEK